MIEALKYFASSDLDVTCGARLSNTRSLTPLRLDPREGTRSWGLFLFIACDLEFFMMASVQRSIHQGHFSELFRGRQLPFNLYFSLVT